MDLIGRTFPPGLACQNCGKELDHQDGIYVDTTGNEPQPVCHEHAEEEAAGVTVQRRSRPESDERWDEWYVITSVPDGG